MYNQSVILSKDIVSGDITPLVSSNNTLLTSRPSLNQLTNVEITTPTNNQVLTYNSVDNVWYNAASQGGGGGGGDGDYLSYSVNAYPLNSKFTDQTFFSIFATSTFNTSPSPVYNYNFPNNPAISPLTLSTETGVITGLDANKTYTIELSIMRTAGANSGGIHTMSLFTDSPDAIPAGTSIVLNNALSAASATNTACFTQVLNVILTGQTQICPVLRYSLGTYLGVEFTSGFNATINIKEITSGGESGTTTLTELTDVAIVLPQQGDALTYDATTEKWGNSVIASKTELSQLDDVNLLTPQSGQYLQYDASTFPGKWINKTPDYFNYSVNYVPISNDLFINDAFFSLLDTVNRAASVENFNTNNNLTLTNGLITGLTNTKYYEIEIICMSRVADTTIPIDGFYTLGIYDSPITTGSVITKNVINTGTTLYRSLYYKTILTGPSSINPVLKFTPIAGEYEGTGTTDGFCVNVTIREL